MKRRFLDIRTRLFFGKVFEKRTSKAFSLIEVMVACAILMIMTAVLLSFISTATRVWQQTESQKSRRESGRIILENIKRDLESASFPINPKAKNNLQFILNDPIKIDEIRLNPHAAFWQIPDKSGTYSEVGYFVQWKGTKPVLCRYYVPSNAKDSFFYEPDRWLTPQKISHYAPGLEDALTHEGVLAENVIGLWMVLYDQSGSSKGMNSVYDSRTNPELPVFVEVTIAVISPAAVLRITDASLINYTETADSFISSLPAEIRGGVQIYKTKIFLSGGFRS